MFPLKNLARKGLISHKMGRIQSSDGRWITWWRHQMETFSASLAIYAENSPVPGEFPAQRPVTRSFDVFFDLRLNKRLSKQPGGWWFETPAWSLWRHHNDTLHGLCADIVDYETCVTLYNAIKGALDTDDRETPQWYRMKYNRCLKYLPQCSYR